MVGVDINVSRCLVIFAEWFVISKVMSRKLTTLRLDISLLKPSNLKVLIIFFVLLKFLGHYYLG